MTKQQRHVQPTLCHLDIRLNKSVNNLIIVSLWAITCSLLFVIDDEIDVVFKPAIETNRTLRVQISLTLCSTRYINRGISYRPASF